MTKDKKPISDEKTAASSYILTFYQEVMYLTNLYAQYRVAIKKLAYRYGSDLEKLSDFDRTNLDQSITSVTMYVEVVYVKYQTLINAVDNIEENKELVNAYTNIKDAYVLKGEDLYNFVLQLNFVLAEKIMKGLLESSQDLVNEVFKE